MKKLSSSISLAAPTPAGDAPDGRSGLYDRPLYTTARSLSLAAEDEALRGDGERHSCRSSPSCWKYGPRRRADQRAADETHGTEHQAARSPAENAVHHRLAGTRRCGAE